MRGYDDHTYGDAFADVYDDWYDDVSDVASTVSTLADLARTQCADLSAARIVELGVGTGRIAVPLAAEGPQVAGIDTSHAMLTRLGAKSGGRLHAVLGDMVGALPNAIDALGAPAHVVFVAYNTFFSLPTADRQAAAFAAVHDALAPGGCFVIEAFVPVEPDGAARRASVVGVRSVSADRVVLSVDTTDPASQSAEGQYIEFTEAGGIRLRPWAIRWSTPAQLDAMAQSAGMYLADRWSGFDRQPLGPDDDRHVSVYRRIADR